MKTLLERIAGGEILIADGAMGTLLLERGLEAGACPESLNLEKPELLEEIAGLYLEAGADIVHTNTFGGSPLKLALYNLEDRTEEINAGAVRAAIRAVGDRASVSASVGPSGKLLKPFGDTEPEELFDCFLEQIKALICAGADMITVETMTDLTEATAAVYAAKSILPSIPVAATMTFDPTPRGFHTVMGVGVEEACDGLEKAGANIVGSNCGNGIEKMIEIAREFAAHSSLPFAIQSNAGLPVVRDGRTEYPETPEFMAERIAELIDAGVSVIGGCCGTTPKHISAFRKAVNALTGDKQN